MRRLSVVLLSLLMVSTCAPVRTLDFPDATSESHVAVIPLEGPIDEENVQGVKVSMFSAYRRGAKVIILEINSPGGIVDYGFALVKFMEASPVPVVCVVDGEADSMAFYILQACTTRFMTKRSLLMIHQPKFRNASGRSGDLQGLADNLKALTRAMAEFVSRRMKISVDQLLKNIENKDWWMGWQEAIAVGAVDEVVNTTTEVHLFYSKNTP